ncbi:MAG: nucleotidyltransferase [Bacilli bacterium]|nr:nucleotidyltransferase [Bacilli bacterium]
MKIAGIIVEYNPFHNGHLYHLQETKRITNCDVLIAVMSGNFTERGEVAILDKHVRTRLALEAGCDVVIELPYLYAVASADLFSYGAIYLLNQCGVSEIVFGSESNDYLILSEKADLINQPAFDEKIKVFLAEGFSYPKAAELALSSLTNTAMEIKSNDILGIQYIRQIKRINPNIKYHTITRLGNAYHDQEIKSNQFASATAIRKAIKENKEICDVVPPYTAHALKNECLHFWEDYYPFLKYQILANHTNLHNIHDISEGLEKAIINAVKETTSFADLASSLVSKRYTKGRIQRCLTHILNNITKNDVKSYNLSAGPKCLRILGLRQDKSFIIQQLKKISTIPIVTNITRDNYNEVKLDLQVSQIYHLIDNKEERKIPIIF